MCESTYTHVCFSPQFNIYSIDLLHANVVTLLLATSQSGYTSLLNFDGDSNVYLSFTANAALFIYDHTGKSLLWQVANVTDWPNSFSYGVNNANEKYIMTQYQLSYLSAANGSVAQIPVPWNNTSSDTIGYMMPSGEILLSSLSANNSHMCTWLLADGTFISLANESWARALCVNRTDITAYYVEMNGTRQIPRNWSVVDIAHQQLLDFTVPNAPTSNLTANTFVDTASPLYFGAWNNTAGNYDHVLVSVTLGSMLPSIMPTATYVVQWDQWLQTVICIL